MHLYNTPFLTDIRQVCIYLKDVIRNLRIFPDIQIFFTWNEERGIYGFYHAFLTNHTMHRHNPKPQIHLLRTSFIIQFLCPGGPWPGMWSTKSYDSTYLQGIHILSMTMIRLFLFSACIYSSRQSQPSQTDGSLWEVSWTGHGIMSHSTNLPPPPFSPWYLMQPPQREQPRMLSWNR